MFSTTNECYVHNLRVFTYSNERLDANVGLLLVSLSTSNVDECVCMESGTIYNARLSVQYTHVRFHKESKDLKLFDRRDKFYMYAF